MEEATWLFWSIVLVGLAGGALLGRSVRHRLIGPVVLAGICIAVLAASASLLWSVWGACLLPYPDTVAYRPGMTLCPGQSTQIELEIKLGPNNGRDL
jgi:hypothetical protein